MVTLAETGRESRAMKKLLNTLFVTRQGTYLAKDGECVAVKEDDEILLRVPIHTLESVFCFGRVSASPFLMGFCGENRVLLSFLTENGKFLARCQGPVTGNVLLRREQYRAADDAMRSAAVARSFIFGKVANSRVVLQRSNRERSSDVVNRAAVQLGRVLDRVERCADLDSLRGIEGEAGHIYFSAFDEMVVAQKESFQFTVRSRRPPLDRVNALLSFVYTLLVNDCVAGLESVGLDPYCGFLHRDRPGRPSLALDLMEELRPILADRLVLTLINRQQVKASSFRSEENGAVWLTDAARKDVLAAWQERKREEVLHPIVEERAALGLFPYIQSLLLARHLRGDLGGYPSLLWK
jgi:CRISPR-associated protein Cas1